MNKGYKIYFWSRTPIYLTVGKVTMYKGIRSEQSLEWIPKTDVYTNFTKINNGGFFSVVMELKDSQLKDAMDYIRGGNLNYIYDAVGYLFASKNRSLDYSSIDNFLSKNFCNNILNNFINKQTTILVFGNLVVKNLELFFKVIDIDLLIIYGATEVVTYISYSSTKYDITNKLNPQLNVEIKDLTTNNKLNFNQTGLIKIRGKQLMKEYYDDEQKTKEVFDNEGYYTIGDLGYISNDGCLYFEGREKNIIVLNNGEKINPVKIEDICKESLFIDQIIVVGQEKPYLTALVVLNKEYVDKWIKKQKVNIYNDYIDSLKKEILIEINNLIGENKFFKWIEQVKNISFIEEPFTVENGMLTKKYTMARNKIYAHYKEIIENMYK